ncbi:unnamed protein product [Phytophthora fragariaefolia]|uniref:Unnamed protein product n=1 Tax=Phytophthora fragariaefolia TaxID=1490495 RepID=A0A9W6X9J7_9STRA|nr:unnamed protein product [Phytophthora fragariaefolia]
MINSRRGQLTHKFDEAALHNIVAEFKELRRDYDVSNMFRQAVKESDTPLTTFDDMWPVEDAASKFPTLAEFCGGFASVFPNTATVERDFSVINCEETDKRTSLTDPSLSLESKHPHRTKNCMLHRTYISHIEKRSLVMLGSNVGVSPTPTF